MNNQLYTLQRLKDYALWYYFRYYPSDARLVQKLREKGSEEDSISVFKSIEHLLQEDEIIKAKIDTYMFRNKNYRYIRQKMHEKLFPREKIEQYLTKFLESGISILTKDFLRKKIEILISKGKSRYYIFQKLGETREDREMLETLLEEYFIDGESENILKEYEKLKRKYSKEKNIQKLIVKGFRYEEIKKIISE